MHDPAVVYAIVTALIVALAAGIFFASPLRTLLTGPDETNTPDEPTPSATQLPDQAAADGPWSTAPPTPDQNWPKS